MLFLHDKESFLLVLFIKDEDPHNKIWYRPAILILTLNEK